jgi:hypothetical protein
MNPENNIRNIADASKPNAGRMYDYFLGGDHNFEIDRQASQKVFEILPIMPQVSRLIRWFLGEATRRLCDEGFDKFLDFASGLPTVDHIHQIAPKGTKVIYSDIDPVTVAYALDIIGDDPNVRCVQCDIAKPEELLESSTAKELIGKNRKVAVGFNGIAYFLPDETVGNSLNVIYDWVEKGSKLFMCDLNVSTVTEGARDLQKLYESLGQSVFYRSREKLRELSKRWNIVVPGPMALEEWVEMKQEVQEIAVKDFAVEMYGIILQK